MPKGALCKYYGVLIYSMSQIKRNTAFEFKYLQLYSEFGLFPLTHPSVEPWSQLIRFLAYWCLWFKNTRQKCDERSKIQSEYPSTLRILKQS